MERVESVPIRRLVVALDASPCSQIVLRTAARLAGRLGARLEGVFVQDTSLARVADLSVAHAVSVHSARSRPFTRAALEREQRILAEQMDAWAATVARANNVGWRFQILSGPVAPQLMTVAGKDDLLTVGRFGWPVSGIHRHLGSVARTVAAQHRYPLLLLDQEIQPHRPILAIIEAPIAWPRLILAAQMAVSYASPLIALLVGEDEEAASLQTQVETRLADYNIAIDYRPVRPHSLAKEIMQIRAGALFSQRRSGIEQIPLALFLV